MIALYLLLAMLVFSVAQRVRIKKRVYDHGFPEQAKPSPLSEAIVELVSLAGGIYLSLLLLVSFLQIELPGRLNIFGLQTDPLAFSALVLAILQPFFIRARVFLKKGGS